MNSRLDLDDQLTESGAHTIRPRLFARRGKLVDKTPIAIVQIIQAENRLSLLLAFPSSKEVFKLPGN